MAHRRAGRIEALPQELSALRQALVRALKDRSRLRALANAYGEEAIAVQLGRHDENTVPGSYADYEEDPREYDLSVLQSLVRVNTRVSDLYTAPIDQLREQLRLTIETIQERQEYEVISNPIFGLRANVAASQRIPTRSGPPTPDDLDELLARVWKKSAFLLAHPRRRRALPQRGGLSHDHRAPVRRDPAHRPHLGGRAPGGANAIGEQCRRDLRAVVERDPACRGYFMAVLYDKGFQALESYRMAQHTGYTGVSRWRCSCRAASRRRFRSTSTWRLGWAPAS